MSKLAKLSSAYSYYGITGPITSSATALPAHRAPPPLILTEPTGRELSEN